MVEFEVTKHNNKNNDEIENSIVALDKEAENFPDITSPAMMEECVHKEHYDNNVNETDANIHKMNSSEGT